RTSWHPSAHDGRLHQPQAAVESGAQCARLHQLLDARGGGVHPLGGFLQRHPLVVQILVEHRQAVRSQIAKALGRSTPMPNRPSPRAMNWFLVNSTPLASTSRCASSRTYTLSFVKSPRMAVPAGTLGDTTRFTSG